jgi:hypothetical protein
MFAESQSDQHDARRDFFGGIAPGLESTTVALLDPAQDAPLAVYTVVTGRSKSGGLARYATYARSVKGVMQNLEHHGTPVLVAVRGYSLKGRSFVHGELIELGALLRWQLLSRRWAVSEIPPGTLQRFTTGGTDTSMTAVATALAALYRCSFDTPREAEAYGLAHIARALVYPQDYTPEQVRALADIARVRAMQARLEQEVP